MAGLRVIVGKVGFEATVAARFPMLSVDALKFVETEEEAFESAVEDFEEALRDHGDGTEAIDPELVEIYEVEIMTPDFEHEVIAWKVNTDPVLV